MSAGLQKIPTEVAASFRALSDKFAFYRVSYPGKGGCEMERKKAWFYSLLGAAAGFLNGLFGAGGGVAVVPLLERAGVESKKAHATSIAIILPLSVFSALLYLRGVTPRWGEALRYLPMGIVGAVLGAWLLKRIDNRLLRRIFGCMILLSAVRLWFR